MEKSEQIPLEKELQKVSVVPHMAEQDIKSLDREALSKPRSLKHSENRESKARQSTVDLPPEEEQHKKSIRQSDRSVSSTSTCSSVAYSSPESDQVFSEEEDIQTKRKTLRKTKSWKTFFTMVHWSLRRQNSWVQLAGHEGNFKASERGHILKKFSPIENACLVALMEDVLRPYVPTYYGLVERDEQTYIKMEDLLMGLEAPSIMDCKIGIRTYLEEELAKALLKPTPRKDMYNKMVALEPEAPTPEEHKQQAVTKPRYMQWRESVSSTASLGFRIEGVTVEAGPVKKNFKKMKSRDNIMDTFVVFTKGRKDILAAYLERLENMQAALQKSEFFRTHEVIGSSLLFVHDRRSFSNVWMIDFGKTTPAPSHITLRHDVPWEPGTHEDGYLFGLKNLIASLRDTMHMVEETAEVASECTVQEEEEEKDTVKEKTLLKCKMEGNTTNGENKEL
ncbi:inositol-trisphosphate 3-kinase B-like [Hyla sarda]|uniref:inositol-trisphosphate 3-kinase B-like n=1 Tax=Hyla sarda TaxID=327740 RepID=UPI0024C2FCB0|nr:inositol-trisphosphate 3-kinase B-like [Hyla sarda]XP_056383025.1 inositol-trisphosphate 3-kinase B-like [Hyla sarda]XP_056383026.1 inositol-trisphosphate 3-kinase B-like [Hyla sarda]